MKPAVGGIPASESRKTSITTAAGMLRLARPLKSDTDSPAYPLLSSRMTSVNAPKFMNVYASR